MSIFNLFKGKTGGIIKVLGLTDFWESLSSQERKRFGEWYADPYMLGPKRKPSDIDDPKINIVSTTETGSNFLRSYVNYAVSDGDYLFAERLLNEAIKRATNVDDKHFAYQDAAEFYYKLRDSRTDALDLCEQYCRKDIEIARQFLKKHGKPPLPRITTLSRLAIILEKQNRYGEAIEVSKKALALKQGDGTKGGYDGRIERLQKKLVSS